MKYDIRKFSHKSILRRLLFSVSNFTDRRFKPVKIEINHENRQIKTTIKINFNKTFKVIKKNINQYLSLPISKVISGFKNNFRPRKKFLNKEKN